MPNRDTLGVDRSSPPFDRFRTLRWLAPARSGHRTTDRGRHQLYVGREHRNPVDLLVKVTARPGLIYERDLDNEIRSLSTINRELPDSRYFPIVDDHGRLADGRLYLISSLFDEFPLATTIDAEPAPGRLVGHLRTGIEIARALAELHGLGIFHVDLNPMNVLYRATHDRPTIRLIDFESSYERRRHGEGEPYSPPTTPGFSAPEVTREPPGATADVYSLGALLHALLAGQRWAAGRSLESRIRDDRTLDDQLRAALGRAVDTNPRGRFPTIDAFRDAIGAYLERIWPGRAW